MKTQAFVIEGVKAPFVLQDVELGEPLATEVLVQIKASGLCHTDLSIQQGHFPSAFPSIVGHEGSGVVVSVGASVTSLQPGDAVLLSFSSCGKCHFCQDGHPVGCDTWVERNFGRLRGEDAISAASVRGKDGREILGSFFGQSSFAKHAIVAESSCVRVPSTTDLITLSPLGCGLQTGAGTIFNILKIEKSSTVVIFGLGAVGMGALFAAATLKPARIIVVDLVESRLELAKSLGATDAINGKDANVAEQVRRLTSGLGAHFALEATGSVRVLRTAYESVRKFGTVCSLGTPGPGFKPPFDIHEHVDSAKRYIGVVEGDSNPPEFLPILMKLYEEGKFPVDKISKVYSAADFDQAVEAMKSGEVIKPIIVF